MRAQWNKLWSKLKKKRFDRVNTRSLPSWVTWNSDSLEYTVDSLEAFPKFLQAMGNPEMNTEVYHACRKGITKLVTERMAAPGMVRLSYTCDDWVPYAKDQPQDPSLYRKYMDQFKELVK